VRSIEKYGRPWVYEDPSAVWVALKQEVASSALLRLEEVDDDKKYLHAVAKSAVPPTGVDDVEFLLLPEDHVIFYRSNSREVVQVGGAVVGDGGSHMNRLNAVKSHLRLREMGDYAEDDDYKMQERPSLVDNLKRNFGYTSNRPDDVNFMDNSVPSSPDDQ
jgi:uncharacterized protein (DUF1499 family)